MRHMEVGGCASAGQNAPVVSLRVHIFDRSTMVPSGLYSVPDDKENGMILLTIATGDVNVAEVAVTLAEEKKLLPEGHTSYASVTLDTARRPSWHATLKSVTAVAMKVSGLMPGGKVHVVAMAPVFWLE